MPIFLRTAGDKISIWSNEKDEPVHYEFLVVLAIILRQFVEIL